MEISKSYIVQESYLLCRLKKEWETRNTSYKGSIQNANNLEITKGE